MAMSFAEMLPPFGDIVLNNSIIGNSGLAGLGIREYEDAHISKSEEDALRQYYSGHLGTDE